MHPIIDEGKQQYDITSFNYVSLLSRFEIRLPDIFQYIHQAWSTIDGRLRAEQFKVDYNKSILKFFMINSALP